MNVIRTIMEISIFDILYFILIDFMFCNLYMISNYTTISNNTTWKYNNIQNKK